MKKVFLFLLQWRRLGLLWVGVFSSILAVVVPLTNFGINLRNLGIEGYLLLLLVSFIISIGIEFIQVWLNRSKDVLQKIRKGSQWLSTCKVFWGRTRYSNAPKIANTVEGIMALVEAYKFLRPPLQKKSETALQKSLSYLLSSISEEGLLSLSVRKPTVHTTAMALYALVKVRQKKYVDFDDSLDSGIRMLSASLQRSFTQYGWGFLNLRTEDKRFVRFFFNFMGFESFKCRWSA